MDDDDHDDDDGDDDIVPSSSTPRMLSEDEDTEAFETDQELLLESCEVYAEGVGTHTQSTNKKASKEIQLRELDSHDFELLKQAIHKE